MSARLGSLILCAVVPLTLLSGCFATRQPPPSTTGTPASDQPDLSKLKAVWPYTLVIYPHQDGTFYVAVVCANEFKVRRPELTDTGVTGPEQPVNTMPTTQAGGGPPQVEIGNGWAYVIGSAPMVGSQTVAGGSDGSRIIVDQSWNRIIGTATDKTISVWGHSGNAAPTQALAVGSYVDGQKNMGTGKIDSWNPVLIIDNLIDTSAKTLIDKKVADAATAVGLQKPR